MRFSFDNARIEKLSGSDLVWKQNEQLARQNRELQRRAQKARDEAAAEVSAAKKECSKKEQELERQLDKTLQREKKAREVEMEYNVRIDAEAKRITEGIREAAERACRRKTEEVENEYEKKRNAIYGVTVGSLLYGFFATILTACNSVRIEKDASAFVTILWRLISGPVPLAIEACKTIWKVRDMIPYQILGVLTAALLVILAFVLITGLIYGIVGFVVFETVRFYHTEFWDLASAVVALESLGILVWSADRLTWLTWNLVLVWLLIHSAYILIRMMISASKNSQY